MVRMFCCTLKKMYRMVLMLKTLSQTVAFQHRLSLVLKTQQNMTLQDGIQVIKTFKAIQNVLQCLDITHTYLVN